jgi:hypothetical protein
MGSKGYTKDREDKLTKLRSFPMAYITTAKPALSLGAFVARPFTAIWSFLILLAEAHPKMNAVDRLSKETDEELAARGTDRGAEVRRIFAGQLHL